MKIEFEYISMEGRHVKAVVSGKDWSECHSELYSGSGDDPHKIISEDIIDDE